MSKATAVKPYKAVREKFYAETERKWRPATEEELAALRAAALDWITRHQNRTRRPGGQRAIPARRKV